MTDTSFDMAALSAKHTSPETARRIRGRHWAEFRLKAYGIAAIMIAGTALIILMSTILLKTLGIVNEFYLSIDTQIEVSDRNMARLEDPNPRMLPNLDRVAKAAIQEAAGGDVGRRERRELYSLMSTDAGLELGKLVKANRDLIGSKYQYSVLLDDQVQLYLKGDFGKLRDGGTSGAITITPGENDGEVIIETVSNAFADSRKAMQLDRGQEARVFRRIAVNQARAFDETEALLENETDPAKREAMEAGLETFRAGRDDAQQKANIALTDATALDTDFLMRTDDPSLFIRANQGWIKITHLAPERLEGIILDPLSGLGDVAEGDWTSWLMTRPEAERKISDRQLLWLENFKREGKIETHLNTRLLLSSDSSNAELAGIWGALIGSFWTMMVTFLLAFPIGVMASIYLEEFAPKNRLTQFIEVNINNLAAVPSIVFGLLGLTILLSGVTLFGVDLFGGLLKAFSDDPRSTPLVGGVVLALMSLPTIIIAARASIKAVPPSIRDAALGLGASKLQTSTHHVLPLAMPGILTGSIIAMAQALGETAPLIIVGMNAFIQDPPGDPLDKANVLPSLIYLWNNQSERLFDGKTAAAISVLLIFLILMNALAVVLRKRFERRW